MIKVRPLRGFVFLQILDQESTSASGLTIPDIEKQRQAKGLVLAVGSPRIYESGIETPNEIEEGDKVVFKRFAGEIIKDDGKEYALIPYSEVLGVYE